MSKLEFSSFRIALVTCRWQDASAEADIDFLDVFQGQQEQSMSEEVQADVWGAVTSDFKIGSLVELLPSLS